MAEVEPADLCQAEKSVEPADLCQAEKSVEPADLCQAEKSVEPVDSCPVEKSEPYLGGHGVAQLKPEYVFLINLLNIWL
jgi:hypothetical protein